MARNLQPGWWIQYSGLRLAACAGLKQVAMASQHDLPGEDRGSSPAGVTGIASASDGGVAVAVDSGGVPVAVGYGGVSAAAGYGGVLVAVGHGCVAAVVDGTRENQ